ncbi:BamA/TamA family outer membrane protein [Foetidibacter luteolus]|uniref:BamA/TamA family outer membrane protein n=1 Tax=Foetidibacter luteolus TaxID=2608880 RepID=UPI001A98BCCF|nr:BamA/TamA family outer membrane protein [Foetidibacter luteolus]
MRLAFFSVFIALNLLSITSGAQKDSVVNRRTKKLMVLPVMARSVETGWSFGAVAASTFRIAGKDTVSRTSNIQALALYSLKHQLIAAINGSIYFPKEKYIINHQFSYSYFPDKCWGLGSNTPDSAEEPYKFRQYYVYLHPMKKIGRGLFAGVLYEQQNVLAMEYEPGGLFDKQKIAGRKGYFVSGLGLSLTYDSRNNAFAPNSGAFAQLYFNHFAPYIGSDFTYTNIVQDIRKYIPLFKKQVLALQFYNVINAGPEVPVRSLAQLGGSSSMRGFYNGRFRDKQMMVIQSEYRLPVYGCLGAVLFGAAGDVTRRVMDYSLRGFKFAYGGGLRFALNKKERLNLRLDYGVTSTGNHGFYFQLGEAF